MMKSLSRDAVASGLAGSQAEFGLNLYRLVRKPDENLIFSPYVLFTVLAMACAGARGKTADQMCQALHLHRPFAALRKEFSQVQAAIARSGSADENMLKDAAALWPHWKAVFLPEFLSLNQDAFNASLTNVDYHRPEEARQKINRWADEHTAHKVPDLIPPGLLTPLTRFVLTNAIYFKGAWKNAFDRSRTRSQPFRRVSGITVETPMMNRTGTFGYLEKENFQLLELPYRGANVSFIILLPASPEDLPDLENNLSVGKLWGWFTALKETEVNVTLPKFQIAWGGKLKDALMELGIRDAFLEDRADFSGMTNEKPGLMIDQVVQKAVLDVYEEGSEAAAASAVVMKVRSLPAPPLEFRADRPFIYFIREKKSGCLLFMGHFVNPEEND